MRLIRRRILRELRAEIGEFRYGVALHGKATHFA
jgi:hypothetical protein